MKSEIRSLNGISELKKSIVNLGYKHSIWQVFEDFVTLSACSISNTIDFLHREDREKIYLDIIKKYTKKEAEEFPKMLALLVEALDMALSALRPITREQVEKVWRGEWEWFYETVGTSIDGYEREWGWRCSKCKIVLPDEFNNPDDSPVMHFCQWCGAPMTDEAVQMVMKRMEALYGDR